MTELQRESGEALKKIRAQAAAQLESNQDYAESGELTGLSADTYDALDYRLMATFPASDAVAQY